MGVLQALGDKLRGSFTGPTASGSMPGATIRYNLYQLIEAKSEMTRVVRFQKLYDYYIGDAERIRGYLTIAMGKTFAQETIDEMQLLWYNITRRVIDRLCLAYKLPAERHIVVPKTPKGEKLEPDSGAQLSADNYQELLNLSNVNAQAKRWHRLSKLCDTVYVGVVWRVDHVEYDIYPPHLIFAQESDKNFLEPDLVAFKKVRRLEDGATQLVTIAWSQDKHWIQTSDDKAQAIEGSDLPDGTNPYGLLPYAPLRMREIENHWGEGDTQLVEANEQINVILTAGQDNVIMQSHGQAVAINMGLSSKIQTGPKHIIQVEKANAEYHAPSFEFKHPEPATKELMEWVDWVLKRTAVDHGLPPTSVSLEERAQSGAAKAMDNWEMIEMRQDDIEILRPFEKRLFDISVAVWNYHNPQKRIDPKSIFGIDFQEIELPQPEKDVLDNKAKKLQMGLWTPVDDVIDEDEGVDKNAALQIIQENLEVRNALNDEYGIMQIAKSNNQDPNNEGQGGSEGSHPMGQPKRKAGGDPGGDSQE